MRDKFSILDEEPKKEYEEILVNKILIGSIIKTEYDEDRIKIQEKHNPKRILNNGNFLFGCLFDPNEKHINVINQIKKYKEIDLYTYNKILQEKLNQLEKVNLDSFNVENNKQKSLISSHATVDTSQNVLKKLKQFYF